MIHHSLCSIQICIESRFTVFGHLCVASCHKYWLNDKWGHIWLYNLQQYKLSRERLEAIYNISIKAAFIIHIFIGALQIFVYRPIYNSLDIINIFPPLHWKRSSKSKHDLYAWIKIIIKRELWCIIKEPPARLLYILY